MDEKTEARFGALESEISKLKHRRKDGWDRLQILSAAMIPIAIAAVGTLFSVVSSNAQLQVSQANLVSSFVQPLTGTPQERVLAMHALKIAFPERWAEFMKTAVDSDPNGAVRAYAYAQMGTESEVQAVKFFRAEADYLLAVTRRSLARFSGPDPVGLTAEDLTNEIQAALLQFPSGDVFHGDTVRCRTNGSQNSSLQKHPRAL